MTTKYTRENPFRASNGVNYYRDPSAVLAAMRSRIDQAPMSRFDRDAGRLLADALQAVLDRCETPEKMIDSFSEGYNTALDSVRRIITTALAKGETS